MKIRTGRQIVRPILFKNICWPVKIRVRAEPPLLAPRFPPDFPASPLFGRRREAPSLQLDSRAYTQEACDWRVLGEQDWGAED